MIVNLQPLSRTNLFQGVRVIKRFRTKSDSVESTQAETFLRLSFSFAVSFDDYVYSPYTRATLEESAEVRAQPSLAPMRMASSCAEI